MKLSKNLLEHWHRLPEHLRLRILDNLSHVLNYLCNGVLLAVPVYVFCLLVFKSSPKVYLLMIIPLAILLAFIEHYYIFFRHDWRKSL